MLQEHGSIFFLKPPVTQQSLEQLEPEQAGSEAKSDTYRLVHCSRTWQWSETRV